MANICQNTIAVVGLQESPEEFIRKLSKVMFDIDLDNMDVNKWGNHKCEGGKLQTTYRVVNEQTGETELLTHVVNMANLDTSKCEDGKYYSVTRNPLSANGNLPEFGVEEIDPKTWYKKILTEKYPPLGVLVPRTPFRRCGITVPRFYVETKWRPVYDEVEKASEAFPNLLFHVHHFLEPDGPTGEFVVRDGKVLEQVKRRASWYLFDQLTHPMLNLLPAHMGLTLAQQGTSKVQDALETVEQLGAILDDPRFIDSPFHEYRNGPKLSAAKRALDDLLAHMRKAAGELTFDGVLLEEAEAAAIAAEWESWADPAG